MESGVFITQQLFPALFEWFARHIFALPVHNALAERQFNIATFYLDPNTSEESIQAIQLFVQNIVHQTSGKSNKLRMTALSRVECRQKMAEYSGTVTPELVVEAKRSSSSLWMLLLKN